jgi:nucleotide-binding universal stress UspA family protein
MASLPESVLVAVDFGEAATRAVRLGGLIADACGATLRLLHAESIEAPPYFTSEQVEALARQRLATRAQAQQFLERFGQKHTTHALTAVVDARSPVEAILHEAQSADLVVMGTHGRHGPTRWWLGSVAERVLRETVTPLMIVRADTGDTSAAFARMVVHAAPSLEGGAALQLAWRLMACLRGEVTDARGEPLEPALDRAHATLLVEAAPAPRSGVWLSHHGDSLIRFCQLPILFVPEAMEGASS